MVSTTRLFTASLILSAVTALAMPRRRQCDESSTPDVLRASKRDGFAPSRDYPINKRARARRCPPRPSSTSLSTTTTPPGGVGGLPTTTPTQTTTTTSVSYGNGGGGGGNNQKPANWPTKTQSGPSYSATAASPSDPYLESISEVSIYTSLSSRLALVLTSFPE